MNRTLQLVYIGDIDIEKPPPFVDHVPWETTGFNIIFVLISVARDAVAVDGF